MYLVPLAVLLTVASTLFFIYRVVVLAVQSWPKVIFRPLVQERPRGVLGHDWLRYVLCATVVPQQGWPRGSRLTIFVSLFSAMTVSGEKHHLGDVGRRVKTMLVWFVTFCGACKRRSS